MLTEGGIMANYGEAMLGVIFTGDTVAAILTTTPTATPTPTHIPTPTLTPSLSSPPPPGQRPPAPGPRRPRAAGQVLQAVPETGARRIYVGISDSRDAQDATGGAVPADQVAQAGVHRGDHACWMGMARYVGRSCVERVWCRCCCADVWCAMQLTAPTLTLTLTPTLNILNPTQPLPPP